MTHQKKDKKKKTQKKKQQNKTKTNKQTKKPKKKREKKNRRYVELCFKKNPQIITHVDIDLNTLAIIFVFSDNVT